VVRRMTPSPMMAMLSSRLLMLLMVNRAIGDEPLLRRAPTPPSILVLGFVKTDLAMRDACSRYGHFEYNIHWPNRSRAQFKWAKWFTGHTTGVEIIDGCEWVTETTGPEPPGRDAPTATVRTKLIVDGKRLLPLPQQASNQDR